MAFITKISTTQCLPDHRLPARPSNPNVYVSLLDGCVYSKAYDTPDPTYVAVWKEVVRYVNWSV